MRLLVVEDEAKTAHFLAKGLGESGFAVDVALNGLDGRYFIEQQEYDLIILDVMLPGLNGWQLLQLVRQRGATPVLFLTARDAIEDRVRGLELGADDYLLKPFAMAELLARMRAVMRRKGGSAAPLLGNGVVSLDPVSKQASSFEQPAVQLSNREFALLQALLIRPGAILSRSELEDRIYGWGEEVESNAVEFLIHALRRKLGSQVIKNVRGLGWMVSKDV